MQLEHIVEDDLEAIDGAPPPAGVDPEPLVACWLSRSAVTGHTAEREDAIFFERLIYFRIIRTSTAASPCP